MSTKCLADPRQRKGSPVKRILITGKTSWIGNELEAHLEQFGDNYEVHRVSLRDDGWKAEDWRGFDSLVHTAAIVHQGEGAGDLGGLYDDVNVVLTRDVSIKAKTAGIPHFIFLSTFAVYGITGAVNAAPIDLNTLPNPRTWYGKSKLEAERQLSDLADDHFAIAIIRPPLVYGPHCTKGNFPRFVQFAARTPIFPLVHNHRSMIYSRNLAELMRLLIENGEGGLFLPQEEQYVCTADMIKQLGCAMGRHIHLSRPLAAPASFLARHNEMFGKIFGSDRYSLEASECGYDYRITAISDSIAQSVTGVHA